MRRLSRRVSVHRVSGESLATALRGLGLDTGVDVSALWEASGAVDEYIGDQPVTPVAPRVGLSAPPSTTSRRGSSLRRRQPARARCRRPAGGGARRAATHPPDVGSPPLAAPIEQILGSQALVHVLSAQRYLTVVDELRALVVGRYGTPPVAIDPGVKRAIELVGADAPADEETVALDDELREQAEGVASSEEELLLGLFGEEAEPLLRAIRHWPRVTTRSRPAASTRDAQSGSARSSVSSRRPASAR